MVHEFLVWAHSTEVPPAVQHQSIETAAQLTELCQQLRTAAWVGFDTEFVSEDTYRPDLCLIQVAVHDILAVIDPRQVRDVTPFWEALCDGDHTTIVHAGREEFRFCLAATGRRPRNLFDTQIAAGMIGLEYPSSYSKLIARLLDEDLAKGETRTDWRRRPLSPRQIEYALQDVIFLWPLHEKLMKRLTKLDRVSWLDEEMQRWQDDLEESERRENWRRVSGATGLPERSMVIVRELWRWREREAEQQNRPARRVLRDDLLVELARRGKADANQVRAIRGIERSLAKRHFPELVECIDRAIHLPRSEWPTRPARRASSHGTLVSQFISTALSSICRAQNLAPSLVGTVQDVRDLVEYRLAPDEVPENGCPSLAQGWRALIVGQTIDRLLEGQLTIRIADPRAEEPLTLEPYQSER
jgi:ribonuclease D